MRITIVQGAFLPVPPVAGGAVEKLWFELGAEFASRGCDVRHVSRAWPGRARRETIGRAQHVRVGGYDYPRSALLAKCMDLAYALRCLHVILPSDVVVTNTFFLPLLLRALPRRGLVYVSVHRYPHGQMAWYGNAGRLQCVSTAVADAVRRQAPSMTTKVKVIPNYVARGLSATEFELQWPARRKELLYVGRIHPEKGLNLLLDAYGGMQPAARDGWTLRIVGPHLDAAGGGGDGYLRSLQRKAEDAGIKVDWVGAVYDTAALNACYARATVFVYPSIAIHGEAFGLAPLEAMAQGCPVVTSDLACFLDYIEPGRNADVFALGPDAAAALRSVLENLMHDSPRQRRHALAALTTVERYSLRAVADAFIADFTALTAR